jgi:transcriptional regulator with PAS, ATPase and Fis domain
LRERKEDIPLLLDYFIKYYIEKLGTKITKIDPAISKELINYPFPGNVRELRNLVERALILSEGGVLKLSDFMINKSPEMMESAEANMPEIQVYDLELSEKRLIKKALEKCNNNKSKAAELLNISWQSLDRRMKKFDLS